MRIASAHVVDEYVQASYITLGAEGVSIEIDLTPGVDVAARVLAIVDADGDGEISGAEGRAYAARVLRDISLTVDGRAVALSLTGGAFPAVSEMRRGEGVIRLRLGGQGWPEDGDGARPGTHRLVYRNSHRPVPSSYLVNAYLPAAPFTITAQHRDRLQHGIEIDYTVKREPRSAWAWIAAGLLIVAGIAAWVRRGVLASR